MLNSERIRTMTKLNRYEEGPNSDYLKLNHMYRSDYIGMALHKNFFCITIGYLLLLGIGCLYHFEFLTMNWFHLDLIAVLLNILKWYVILLVVYSILVYIICSVRYKKMKDYVKFYDQELSNLEEQYGNNTKKNETNQDGRRDTK